MEGQPGGAFEVSLYDRDFFTNSSNEDLNIRTLLPHQRINIGTNSNDKSAMMITSNTIIMNQNLYIHSKLGIGKCNVLDTFPVDIVGNTAIDGSVNATRYVLCRGVQLRKKTGSYYEPTELPTGSVQGISNDVNGMYLYISEPSLSNTFWFQAGNSEVMRLNADGTLRVKQRLFVENNIIQSIQNTLSINDTLYATSLTGRVGINTTTPATTFEVSGTDAILLPRGTTAQRPINPQQGFMRYNSTLGTFEGYASGDTWGSLGGVRDTNQDTFVSAESFPTSNDDAIRFVNSNVETLRMTPAGLLGIRTSNPSEILDVALGNAKISSNIYALSRIAVGHSNPSESVDVRGNTKISSNLYVMNRIGVNTSNPNCSFHVNTVDAIGVPSGTTAQRPSAPVSGHMRYNTTLSTFEGYGPGNSWGTLGGVRDTNQDTYITPEIVTGSNDDVLRFFNSNVETMRLQNSKLEVDVPTTLYKTMTIFPSSVRASRPYVPSSYNVTASNFSISGQPYGNGEYTIIGSSVLDAFQRYELAFDQNMSSRWISGQTFRGPGNTYNSNMVTSAVNTSSNYPGDWIQITIPDNITPTRLRMLTGYGRSQYAVDTFTLLGSSNNGTTWKSFFSSIGTANWPQTGGSNAAFNFPVSEQDTFNTYRVVIYKSYSDLVDVHYIAIDGYIPGPLVPPKLGVGLSNPTEILDIIGSVKASSNMYAMSSIGISTSNPTEAMDVIGNIKAASNIYAMNNLGVGTSNPTEAIDIMGNIKISNSLYALSNAGVGTSNPSEALDILGNVKASSNIYALSRLGIAMSNPTESLDILGNIKASSNVYVMNNLGVGMSNPTEALDIVGNIKGSSNIYVLNSLGVGMSNPTEAMDVMGNLKTSSNVFAMRRLGIATSNPTEALDIIGNIKGSSNIYILNSLGIATSNPTEAIDIIGNIKGSSNVFAMRRLGVATSNPTEAMDILGNIKASSNVYVLNSLGVGTSNPSTTLEVNGGAKINSNLEVMGNLTIRGNTTTVDATTVNIQDNIIRINNGAVYNASLQAGLEINRGTGYSNYMLVFDETTQYFRVGQQGISLQTVATRDDNPTSHGLMIYDNAGKKLTACNSLTFSNNVLEVQGIMSARPSSGDNAFQGLATGLTSGQFLHIALGQSNTHSNAAVIKYTHNGLNNNTNNAQFGLWGFNHITCSANGNVGVNTASPSEALHVAGGKLLASTNQILAYTGDTALVPAYSWGDDSNTGIYHPAADTIAFTNGGSERMRIDSSGNVGIGKTNPGVRLDVEGTLNATTLQQNGSNLSTILSSYATTSSLSSYVTNTSLSSTLTSYVSSSALSSYVTTTSLSSTLSSYASTSSVSGKLNTGGGNISGSLNVSGNLGVGTTNPQYKLDVIGTLRANGNKAYFEDGSSSGLFIDRQFNSAGVVLTANAYFFGGWTRQIGGAGVAMFDMHNGSSSGDPPFFDFNYAAGGGSANSSVSMTRMARIDTGGMSLNGALTITPPSGVRYPSTLVLNEASVGTRTGIQFGSGWAMGQDRNGNGTKDFFIYETSWNDSQLTIYNGTVWVRNLTKNTGSFEIKHPDPVKKEQGYKLRHCFVESPTRGDNIYRFTVTTQNKTATIQLPDYFKHLNEDADVYISAKDVFGYGFGKVNEDYETATINVSEDGTYKVLIIATRKDEDAKKFFDEKGVEFVSETQ